MGQMEVEYPELEGRYCKNGSSDGLDAEDHQARRILWPFQCIKGG